MEDLILDDLTLLMLGYMPEDGVFWDIGEPFVTVHRVNGKYIFSSTGQELKYVSDLQKAYKRFTKKDLTFKSKKNGKSNLD